MIIQKLQEFAEGCKYRISKPVSFLGLAPYCTVLRPRWYQSGINVILVLMAFVGLRIDCAYGQASTDLR